MDNVDRMQVGIGGRICRRGTEMVEKMESDLTFGTTGDVTKGRSEMAQDRSKAKRQVRLIDFHAVAAADDRWGVKSMECVTSQSFFFKGLTPLLRVSFIFIF